jgi:hypothetical protein
MAKKKTGGDHVTPRKPIQMPTDWYLLANKLASKNRQPTLWYLLARIAENADALGLDRPALPWEDEVKD